MTTEDRLNVLDTQQALLTDCLKHMLIGQWTGFPSLEATLGGLSPGIALDPHPPLLESQAGPPPPVAPNYEPWTEQIGQLYGWTCSACATEWVERAAGASRGGDIYANREAVTEHIGYTHNINSVYGLMDGSGAQLQRVLREHAGLNTQQSWLSFDQAYAVYSQSFGLMSGAAYYHWVAVRGVDGGNLWIANSAPGYQGVWDTMSRSQFNNLGGFSCLWVV